MASSNSTTSMTVYLFFRHETFAHSLFKFDIRKPENEDDDWEVEAPSLIQYIPSVNNRSMMGCGRLGSKLYILGGGSWSKADEEGVPVELEFPKDVRVFDLTNPELGLTEGAPMKTGKHNPLMFEVDGLLYVLGSRLSSVSAEPGSLRMFEKYDPTTNEWSELVDPPVEDEVAEDEYIDIYWYHSYVVNSSRVIIQSDLRGVLFIFNPTACKWSKLNYPDFTLYDFYSLLAEGNLYGADDRGRLLKTGLPYFLEDDLKLCLVSSYKPVTIYWGRHPKPSVHWEPHSDSSVPYLPYISGPFSSESLICYLGNRCICVIETGSVIRDCDHFSDTFVADAHNRYFNVFIYKDIRPLGETYELKCLHSKNFTVNTDFSNIGDLTSCHVMSNERSQYETSNEMKKSVSRKGKREINECDDVLAEKSWTKHGRRKLRM